jgi:hypothetical protein
MNFEHSVFKKKQINKFYGSMFQVLTYEVDIQPPLFITAKWNVEKNKLS